MPERTDCNETTNNRGGGVVSTDLKNACIFSSQVMALLLESRHRYGMAYC